MTLVSGIWKRFISTSAITEIVSAMDGRGLAFRRFTTSTGWIGMNSRRREIANWAVENLSVWPAHESLAEADPSDIGCEFGHYPQLGSLPVLRCKFGGGFVSSTDYFYAKRGIK